MRTNPNSINISLIIAENKIRPIMLWVKALWVEIAKAKESIDRRTNRVLLFCKYMYKRIIPTPK